MNQLQQILTLVQASRETYAAVFLAVSRYLIPALGLWLLLHCARPLISFRREPEIWAWLRFSDGSQVAVTHWENVIGRSKSSDINIALSTVSRNHAVLTRRQLDDYGCQFQNRNLGQRGKGGYPRRP